MDIKIIQLHKKAAGTFDNIEDKVHLNPDNRSVAIADGATQGYQSGFWADLLAGEFILEPVFNKEQFDSAILQKCLTKFNSHAYSIPAPANKALAILDLSKRKEGASATFLGIRISGNGACDVIACGDCLLIRRTPGLQSNHLFPFADLSSLNANTAFISSRLLGENRWDPRILHTEELFVDDSDELYVMTDALARMVFQDPGALDRLNALADFQQLLDFATRNWENGRLDNDDLTLVRITHVREQGVKVQRIVPHTGFSFNFSPPAYSPSREPSSQEPTSSMPSAAAPWPASRTTNVASPAAPPPSFTPPPPPFTPPSPPPPSDLGSLKAELGDLKNYVLNTGASSRARNRQRFVTIAAIVGILVVIQAFILVSAGNTRSRLNKLESWRDTATRDVSRLSDSVYRIRNRRESPAAASTAVNRLPEAAASNRPQDAAASTPAHRSDSPAVKKTPPAAPLKPRPAKPNPDSPHPQSIIK